MASASEKNYEAALSLAKATAKYRSLLEPVKRAVYLHAEHGIPQRRAANEEGVSRASLRRALDAETANREVGMNGRPRFLSVSQEKKLKDEILQRSSGLDAMRHREILEAAVSLKKASSGRMTRGSWEEPSISRTFVYGLVKRSPELKVRKARIMESDRSRYVTPTTLNNFFDKLEELNGVANYSPEMIANFDETMIQCTAKRLAVVGHADASTLYISQSNEMPHITLGVCVFADGTHPPHLVIYPLKKLPSEIDEAFLRVNSGLVFCGQPSGWITAEILENYLVKTVLAHFQSQRLKSGASHRGLLLVDGHASRINDRLWQTFKDNDVDVLTFVSHSSHVLQPLDLSVFGAFKSKLRGGMTALKSLTLSQKRAVVMKRALDSLYHALSPTNIASGFEKAGVYPLNRGMPLGHPAVNYDPSTPQIPSRKRKTVISLDGDVLTSEDTIRRMKQSNSIEPKQRGRPKKAGRKVAKRSTAVTPYDTSDTELEFSDEGEE
jgi:hypothetical protein